MTAPLILLVVAALVGTLAGYPLAQARWTADAPRLAVALWHGLCFGVVSSVVLAGLLLALPVLPWVFTGYAGDLVARCAVALQVEFSAPYSAILGPIGILLAGATMGLGLCRFVVDSRRDKRVRRRQLEVLALAGRRVAGAGGEALVLLDDVRPAAYCLPGERGSRGTVVISAGALDVLDDDQVRLVLAHERAHLHQRHHVVTRISATLEATFSWVPLFRLAAGQVPQLLEMAADDQAMRTTAGSPAAGAKGSQRRRLAYALLDLATAQTPSPSGALAAAGGSAAARVRRLSQPRLRLGFARSTLLGGGVVVAFAGPVVVAAAPALCAVVTRVCPFAFA